MHHDQDHAVRRGLEVGRHRVRELLRDVLRRLEHDDPALGEQRRTDQLGELGRCEFGHPDPGQLGRRVGGPRGVERAAHGAFDEQFFLAQHEMQRCRGSGFGGHGRILSLALLCGRSGDVGPAAWRYLIVMSYGVAEAAPCSAPR